MEMNRFFNDVLDNDTITIKKINEMWAWITMGIGAGMLIPQVIRWYWWRFNGYG